ncbi:helix-turn-helix domain-containing protein [Cellulophaga baltica]|uniref:helix-turn-helix domain-containing protein n=1 Tax=Cellulophaga baltica TaxID=76594 RepID=UPI002493F90F|nr:helix-turn-helix transcriptional regulator [Cellulophaga baltica]
MLSVEYFGIKLKELRKERSLTQSQFAEICGLSQAQVTRYENGQNAPTSRILERIATGLNVSIDVFNEVNEITIASLDADYERLRNTLNNPHQKVALRFLLRSFYLSAKTKLILDESFHD